jgi:large subunit ribosomal protein L25
MPEAAVLLADGRSEAGKGSAKRLRGSGRIPAVVYGPEIHPVNCSVDQREFAAVVAEHGRNAIITLNVQDGESGHSTIIKEVQHNAISGQVLHVDFHRISLTKRIVVQVRIHSEGTPVGVRNDGGILEQLLHEVEVECLPTEIPTEILFDVSDLSIGDSVHVFDLPAQGQVTFVTDGDRSVFVLAPPTVRQTDEEDEDEIGEDVEETQEPEVIERGKRDDEEAEEAA